MAQNFSVRTGLKRFGDRGEKAVSKDLTQLKKMHKYDPVDPKEFTNKQRMDAFNSIMFLIDKRNGDGKARSCSDGIKQRNQENYRKEDYTSSTCSNEGVMITSAIKSHAKRNVVIIDIPGAFLHALTDEEI